MGESKQKREKMVEKRKIEAIAAKRRRNRGGINLSIKKETNYESDIEDDTKPDQANNKYPL